MLLPALALASRHLHIRPGWIAAGVILAALIYVLVVIVKPTRQCPTCDGERVQVTKHWWSGKESTVPCQPCMGTGRTPWPGGVFIHKLIWSIRQERIERNEDRP